MKILLIFLLFLLLSAYLTVKINSLDLNDPGDRMTFFGKFWLFVSKIGKNMM